MRKQARRFRRQTGSVELGRIPASKDIRARMNREWAAWPFRGVSLSRGDKRLIQVVLSGRGFSHLTPITPAVEPFGLPPGEFEDWLRKNIPGFKKHPGHLWPEVRGAALEILKHLEKLGILRSEVLAAVQMGPDDSQRLAAQVLRSVQRDLSARINTLQPILRLIERDKVRTGSFTDDIVNRFDRGLESEIAILRRINSVVTEYLETEHVKKLLRERQTPVVQRPIIALCNLLKGSLGVRGKHAKPYQLTADFLSEYRPDLFEGLTAHQVRCRIKGKRRPRAPETSDF